MGHDERDPRPIRTVIATTCVVVAVNVITPFVAMPLVIDRYESPELPPQLIWWPAVQVVWLQAGLTGLLLLLLERGRPVGLGLLLGTGIAIALFYAWLLLVLAPAVS